MVDEMLRQMNKKTRYKWTIYINIILFFIIALFLYLLVFDCISVGKFGTEKQLNKLIRNSGINVSVVRSKTKDLSVLQDVIRKGIEGVSAKQISLKYGLEIVLVRDILYEFGLCRKCGSQI